MLCDPLLWNLVDDWELDDTAKGPMNLVVPQYLQHVAHSGSTVHTTTLQSPVASRRMVQSGDFEKTNRLRTVESACLLLKVLLLEVPTQLMPVHMKLHDVVLHGTKHVELTVTCVAPHD